MEPGDARKRLVGDGRPRLGARVVQFLTEQDVEGLVVRCISAFFRSPLQAGPGCSRGALDGRHRKRYAFPVVILAPEMVYVVTPSAVLRPGALRRRKAPRALMPAGLALAPRARPFGREARRLLFQHAPARYIAALLPFPVAMAVWPELALPISQAPLLMLILVLFIETSVLSIGSPEKRRSLVHRDEVARTTDLLAVRGRDLLTRIVARRELASGTLYLVVEQSEMARVPAFTIVSLQIDEGEMVELDQDERTLIETRLFDAVLTERRLHLVNLATDTYLRATALEARTVSAHARLAGMAASARG